MNLFADRSWVFDLDGTLTLPVHDFGMIRRELAIPDGADILGHLGTLDAEEAARRHRILDEIERELAESATASPGAQELLEHLASSGVRVGILTRNSRDVALLTLEAIGVRHLFQAEDVLGRAEAPPKPDPAGILQLSEQWQSRSERLVMVGDYLFDLQAGRSAGAVTIHVARPDGQRWPEQSDLMVEDLGELLMMIREQN